MNSTETFKKNHDMMLGIIEDLQKDYPSLNFNDLKPIAIAIITQKNKTE